MTSIAELVAQLARMEAKLALLAHDVQQQTRWLRAATWLLAAILVVLTYEAVMVTP